MEVVLYIILFLIVMQIADYLDKKWQKFCNRNKSLEDRDYCIIPIEVQEARKRAEIENNHLYQNINITSNNTNIIIEKENIKIENNPSQIQGNWKAGWALDIHTIKSIPLGDGKFDTTYTETGKALNELKYHQNYEQIENLANEVIEFLITRQVTPYLHVIIPIPPSKDRTIQPVTAIAEKVSQVLNIPIDTNYVIKNRSTSELKNIDDPEERKKILLNAFNLQDNRYQNKKILLFDDLFRSGSTLKEITKTLYITGKVQNVYVVTLTKTRSKR